MAKNPFEIRADMIAYAKEYLDQVTALNIEAANKMLEANHLFQQHQQSYSNESSCVRNQYMLL